MNVVHSEGRTYAFVILHYIVEDLTKACVSSIFDLESQGSRVKVVIVDNASPNGTGEALEDYYADNDDVRVIRNASNLGFSAANNIGYSFAQENWQPDAIIVLNNDIRIEQKDFLSVLTAILQETDLYLVFPDVFAPAIGKHQSPLRTHPFRPDRIKGDIAYYQCVAEGGKYEWPTHPIKKFLKRFVVVQALIAARNKRRRRAIERMWRESHYDVVPSGAALIFAKPFLEAGELPFTPETFLYHEEDILALRCERNGWRTLYTPKLQVLHFHRGATNKIVKTDEERERFLAKHFADSLQVLLCCYDEN